MKKRDDLVYLYHILDSILLIEKFTSGLSLKDFIKDEMVSSATIRQLEIIGEASRNISNELKSKYSKIPWRIMRDMRNMLIHEYFGVDLIAVWDTIMNDLPKLKKEIMEILVIEENLKKG